ncbi:MucR family transcriptional regulator [Methylobacterium brachiatum]|jgi:predicted transcriptional regulator|nr:MucR family transcriptional regulator [Methylobacterium brachiatum]
MGYSGRRVDTTAKISDQDRPFKSVDLVTEIVSAYVSKNPLPPAELPMLIGNIHAAVDNLARRPPLSKAAETATPAQIRKSITSNALISFIDGKPYRTLKRHLASHGLDPSSYRERYGLPEDYPMVAASYAALRSQLAKAIGLGSVAGWPVPGSTPA